MMRNPARLLLALLALSVSLLGTACATASDPVEPIYPSDAVRSLFVGTGPAVEATPPGWQDLPTTVTSEVQAIAGRTADATLKALNAGTGSLDPAAFLAELTSGDETRFRAAVETVGSRMVIQLEADGNLSFAEALRVKYPAYMLALAGRIPLTLEEIAELDNWSAEASAAWELYKRTHPLPPQPGWCRHSNALCAEEVK